MYIYKKINNKHGETQYLGLQNLYGLGLMEKVCGNVNILGLIISNMNICRPFFGV